jgi:hypothetical protein
MPTARSFVAFSLTLLIAASSVRADQQHIVAPAQVAAAVADRVAQQDADRAAVADAMKRPEVREFATRLVCGASARPGSERPIASNRPNCRA